MYGILLYMSRDEMCLLPNHFYFCQYPCIFCFVHLIFFSCYLKYHQNGCIIVKWFENKLFNKKKMNKIVTHTLMLISQIEVIMYNMLSSVDSNAK